MIEYSLILIPLLFFSVYAQDAPDYRNPYAPIFTDKKVYTWTDKVHITIVAPSWNANKYGIDSIGDEEEHFVKISTSENSLKPYKLTETDPSSGIFTGEVTLTGFLHDTNGDGKADTNPRTFGNGPTSGFLETDRDEGITISFEFADGVVLTHSAKISWNIGDVQFKELEYAVGETAIIQVIDLDMNLSPEAVDHLELQVLSDSDVAGILVDAIETSEDSGMFVASISFTQSFSSSGNRLFAIPGDSIVAKYDDYTVPAPYSISDNLEISSESKLVSNVAPTGRISINNNSIADSSGNAIDEPTINEQLQIVGAIQNNQDYSQRFIFIIQIKENNETVVSLSWIEGLMSPNQDLEVSQSWIPTKNGNYTIESFVWNSFSDALPLSPVVKQSYLIG